MLNYVQLTFTGTGLLHIYVFKHTLEIRTKKIEKGWVTGYVKEKANVNAVK